MGKKKPKAPRWKQWRDVALPPGTWSSRRQFLMQSAARAAMLLLGGIAYCNHAPQLERVVEPKREILLSGKSTSSSDATGSLSIGVYDNAKATDGVLVATATATNSNTICSDSCESGHRVKGL